MDWNLLKSFLAVGSSGSLSSASKETGISQPTLGRHIAELELVTGLTLFSRGRSGMSMTEQAFDLYEEALEIKRHVDQLSLKAQGKAETISGTVRITASDIVSTYILPPVLAKLGQVEPEIEIELFVSNEIQNLLSRDADIAVRMVQPTQLNLIARRVNRMSMGTYAHKSYLEGRHIPENTQALFGHTVIGYDRLDLMLKVMHGLGLEGGRESFAYRTDDQVAYWELVKAGAGIGFGPNFIAANSPDLVRMLPQVELPSLDMWLASHQELKTSRRIRRVVDFLAAALQELDLD